MLNLVAMMWGAAEATLFFIVPDVFLSAVGLERGKRAALVASICAAIGAALGGAVMYTWSADDPVSARNAVLAVPAISDAMVGAAQQAMNEDGWFPATLAGPLSRTPFKVYAVLAPHAGARLGIFVVATIAARLPRFLLVGLGVVLLRRWLEPRFGIKRLRLAMAVAWVILYAVFFSVTTS